MKWYLKCLSNYAKFTGRAHREEFWMFTLFNCIFGFIFGAIDGLIGGNNPTTSLGLFSSLYCLAVFIPGIAVAIRRLHDIGKSGWWLLISFIPFVGGIWLIILYCTDSEEETNEYGENPKNIQDQNSEQI